MQSQLPVAVASSALRNLALELIRISNDLRLMSSGPMTGLNEIELPALQPGSSIMPGKINPVLPEMVAMVGFQVVGNDVAAALAVQAGQLELNVMMPAMSHAVLTSAGILTEAIHVFSERCIRGLKAHPERCRQYAASTLSLATVLNPYLGYARVAQLVKQALAEGRTIVDLAREQKLLPDAVLAELLDPRASTEPRAPRKTPRPASAPSRTANRRKRKAV
jgi:aspartate ammonia-lyase